MKTNLISRDYRLRLAELTFLVPFLLIFNQNTKAQIEYSYDNNGNRIASYQYVASHAPVRHKTKDSTKISVYPNPSAGLFSVAISSLSPCGYATIYTIDGSGAVLATQTTTTPLTTLDMSSYQ